MEADALKNEIEDMVADMLLNDGKDGNMQKSSKGSKNSKKDKFYQHTASKVTISWSKYTPGLLSFHNVLHERDSMTGNKAVTFTTVQVAKLR